MMDDKEKATIKTFISCDCHTEGIIVSDYPVDDSNLSLGGNVDVSLWSYGQAGQHMSFKERVRWCWNIMLKGLPWNDCVILSLQDARALGEDLIARADKYKLAGIRPL